MKWLARTSVVAAVATALSAVCAAIASAATNRYEAESAPATCDGWVAANHSGYSGSGFCDTNNAVGAAVQFTANVPAAGAATLAIRYANGTTANRAADISVNGAPAHSGYGFEGTGAWATWATKSLTVQLGAATTPCGSPPRPPEGWRTSTTSR